MKLNRTDQQVKRKQPGMGKEPSNPLIFGNRNTRNWKKEAHSTPVKGPAINYNGSVNMKRDHPLWAFALPLGTLTHGGVFGIKCLSRGGESIEEFYIFSVLH